MGPFGRKVDRYKVQSNNYWSSTTYAANTNNAWNVNMNNGNVNNDNKDNNNYVWPVRSDNDSLRLFSFENIYKQYLKCRKNKRNTVNALKFEINCEENLIDLKRELDTGSYYPSRSVCFMATKPKLREIFAADFRDRIVHHVLVDYLERIWEPKFIFDSYACRKKKGIHLGIKRLQGFLRKVTRNGSSGAFYLQLDIKNYFMSIDKDILYGIIADKVRDESVLWLAKILIYHDCTKDYVLKGDRGYLNKIAPQKSLFSTKGRKGLPIGNLTSQFFANVYLNELDQFVKHHLKCRYHLRYCDDFVILSEQRDKLIEWKDEIERFLAGRLRLRLNRKRQSFQPVSNGINFLGYIIRPDYLLVRRRVASNMKTRIEQFKVKLISEQNGKRIVKYDYGLLERLRAVIASYFGHMKWANTYNLRRAILERYGFLKEFFSIDNGRIKPKYRFCEIFPCVRSQYLYYANRFKGIDLFFQVGRFYEFYSGRPLVIELFGLKPLKPNKRGAKYGFPLSMGEHYAKTAVEQGIPVVFVRETDGYIGRIKERLPVMKIIAAEGD